MIHVLHSQREFSIEKTHNSFSLGEPTLLEGPVREQILDDVIMQHPDTASLRCQAVFKALRLSLRDNGL